MSIKLFSQADPFGNPFRADLQFEIPTFAPFSQHSPPGLTMPSFTGNCCYCRFPDYYELIQKPIDLNTIEKRIDRGDYETLAEFHSDITLLFYNVEVCLVSVCLLQYIYIFEVVP